MSSNYLYIMSIFIRYLFLHWTNFFSQFSFPITIMYIVNFTNAMKEIKILSLRNIVNELDLPKKTIIIQ